jgi:phosphoribosylaminoimidazolecarboxamide formyltransferase/IMP cyclohydrolase
VSAFGGIVAFNRPVDAVVAASVNEVFTEVVIAPDYSDEALELLSSKKNVRVLRTRSENGDRPQLEYKQISGGMLVQDADRYVVAPSDLKIVSNKQPDEKDLKAMMMAWRVCKHVKSNAIVLANAFQTLGVGSGQMNRVDSVRISAMRAERFSLPVIGSALASDAFFPFRDNVDEAAKMGVTAIIQPGGSIKDDESIAAADEHGIVMAFTGYRHFKH